MEGAGKIKINPQVKHLGGKIEEIGKQFPRITLILSGEYVHYSGMEEVKSHGEIEAYLKFLINSPEVPVEHARSRMDNLVCETDDQKMLKDNIYEFLDVGYTTPAGLWVSGGTGSGKSHIAVAVGREFFFRKGSRTGPTYIDAENFENDDQLMKTLECLSSYVVDNLFGKQRITDLSGEIFGNASKNGKKVLIVGKDWELRESINEFAMKNNSLLDRAINMYKTVSTGGVNQRTSWYK